MYTCEFIISMLSIGTIGLAQRLNRVVFIIIVLFLSSCSSSRTKETFKTYDQLTRRWVFVYVDEPPVYNNDPKGFMKAFNKHFDACGKSDAFLSFQTKFCLQFVIDKKGRLIGSRIKGKNEKDWTSYERCAMNALMKCNQWSPGKRKGYNVDVLVTCPIVF